VRIGFSCRKMALSPSDGRLRGPTCLIGSIQAPADFRQDSGSSAPISANAQRAARRYLCYESTRASPALIFASDRTVRAPPFDASQSLTC
jgi:hypothetical protein